MNKHEILKDELHFRKWVQTILVEELIHERAVANPEILLQYVITEQGMSGQGFIKAMTDPFKDVLNVAKVATKDLLSIAKFNFDMITSLSPSKQAEARKKWEARNKTLEKEWETAMAPIDAAWEEGDAQLIAFMLNPAGFLGAKAAGAVGDTAVGARDMLDDAGIHLPIIGNDPAKKKEKEKDSGVVDVLGTGKKLLGDLTKLFFVAHYEPTGPLIAEAGKEEKEEKGSGNAEAGAREYIDGVDGFQSKIDQGAKELIASRQEYINEIMQMFEAQAALLTNLADAQDLNVFLQVIQEAEQAGVDIGGAGLGNFQTEIDNGVQSILSNPESRKGFVKTYLESQGQKVPDENSKDANKEAIPEVSDEKLAPEIQKVVFLNSKLGVQEQLFSGTQELKKQTTDAILDGMPDEKLWPLMKKTPLGIEYFSMLEDATKKIESI